MNRKEVKTSSELDAYINIWDSKCITKDGVVELHPKKIRHWLVNLNGNYFDSYGIPLPKILTAHISKK